MKHVVHVAPFLPEITARFVKAAAQHPGASVSLITQERIEKVPEPLRLLLGAHYRVDNALDPQVITDAVRTLIKRRGPVDRLIGTLEHLQVPLGQVRDALGIPGMGAEASENFRDKARMKSILREAGLPCARHQLFRTTDEAWSFVQRVGYPIIIKPPAGAGAKGTERVENNDALRRVLQTMPPHPQRPLLAEEFIRGSEHSFDGVCLRGKLVWHSLTHYYPTPLEAVQNPWIQWCVLLPREVDDPRYDDIRSAAARGLEVLGLDTGVCHLEWFRRGNGTVAISEVGARPGGAQISKLISYAHDMHFYKTWARIVIDGEFTPPERKWAAGAAFLRGQGKGRVKAIHGLAEAQKVVGPLVVETNLPKLGQPPSSSYEGEGYVIMRHPRTEVVKKALYELIRRVRVELG